MKQIVMLAIGLSIVLFTSGCSGQPERPCEPIVKMVKPSMPKIDKAVVEQCRYQEQLDNVKCVVSNYFKMKEERDKLRMALEEITD